MVYLKHQIEYDNSSNCSDNSSEYASYYRRDLLLGSVHCHCIAIIEIRVLIALKLYVFSLCVELLIYAAKQPVCFKRVYHIFNIVCVYSAGAESCTADQNELKDMIKRKTLIQSINYHTHEYAVKEHPFTMSYEPQKERMDDDVRAYLTGKHHRIPGILHRDSE